MWRCWRRGLCAHAVTHTTTRSLNQRHSHHHACPQLSTHVRTHSTGHPRTTARTLNWPSSSRALDEQRRVPSPECAVSKVGRLSR